MEADAYVNLVALLLCGIIALKLRLQVLRALDRVDDRRKLEQETIARRFDDMALVCSHGLLNDLVMDGQYLQRAGFVSTHLTAKAHHVSEHDGGQATGFGVDDLARNVLHERDYSARCFWLSTIEEKQILNGEQNQPDFSSVRYAHET